MENTKCYEVLTELLERGERGQIPWVLLRPRKTDNFTIFEGDFDLLVDETHIEDILEAIFRTCQRIGLSFTLDQSNAFKKVVDLIEDDTRTVTLELWPHAEFRIGSGITSTKRAAIDYKAYAATPMVDQQSLLAALFILHLHHKQKDTHAYSAQWRLNYFTALPGIDPTLSGCLKGLESGSMSLAAAHDGGMSYIRSKRIAFRTPQWITAAETRYKLARRLVRTVPRTVVFVGPDGGGKSTLVEGLRMSIGARRTQCVRFKYYFRRFLPDMRQSEARNIREEKLLWLVLPVAWLYFVADRYLISRSVPALVDRYFYDYFVRYVRDSKRPLQRIAAYRACGALVPRPRKLVVTVCPGDEIIRRKQEMTLESIDKLYMVYLEQIVRARIGETLFCHTGITPAVSTEQVAGFCSRYLSQ